MVRERLSHSHWKEIVENSETIEFTMTRPTVAAVAVGFSEVLAPVADDGVGLRRGGLRTQCVSTGEKEEGDERFHARLVLGRMKNATAKRAEQSAAIGQKSAEKRHHASMPELSMESGPRPSRRLHFHKPDPVRMNPATSAIPKEIILRNSDDDLR